MISLIMPANNTDAFIMFLMTIMAYLIGSLNFAIIITRFIRNDDIRKHGSKNAGTTNVLRVFGKSLAIFVFIGDLFKGILAIYFGRMIANFVNLEYAYADFLIGFCVILGHLFPLYFGLKGGKGVLTSAGVVLCQNFWVCIALLSVFAVVFLFTKIVSLSSISAAIAYPILVIFINNILDKPIYPEILFSIIIASMIVYVHRSNIIRLSMGQEHKFFDNKK